MGKMKAFSRTGLAVRGCEVLLLEQKACEIVRRLLN